LQAEHDVAVEWLPYELRPEPASLPDMSGPRGAWFRQNWQRGVAPLAEQFGVDMRFPPFKPRSRRAHEVAEYAREHDAFGAMRVALFRAFFVEGRNLGDVDVLVDIGESVGLNAPALRGALEAGRYTQRVVELEGIAARLRVSAVPTVVIGGLAIEGVQPYDALRRALIEAEHRADHPSGNS